MLPFMQRGAKRAAEIFHDSGAGNRIKNDGYTRVDPFWVAAHAGVTVMLRPLDKLLGAFVRNETSGILVNADRSSGLIHMTCAHELGHYFLGHETAVDTRIDYEDSAAETEQEADWFAYQLLVPRLLLATVMRRKGWSVQSLKDPSHLYQLSLRLGISYKATLWSLFRQKLLDWSSFDRLRKIQPIEIKRHIVGGELLDSRREVWLVEDSDRSSILEPSAEDQLLLRLRNHASQGYLWTAGEIASKGFQLEPISRQPLLPSDPSELVFGDALTADYLLKHDETADAANGEITALDVREGRPWEQAASLGDTFVANARFEKLRAGLAQSSKERLLQENAAAS